MNSIVIETVGDQIVRVCFGSQISADINERVRNFCILLEHEKLDGIIEWVPSYTSVSIYYNPLKNTYGKVELLVHQVVSHMSKVVLPPRKIITLPVCYEEEFAPDLSYIANYHSLTEQEVIELHCERQYLVYMIGFTPGFPYLGGLNPAIATPRLEVPRHRVEKGSVGIAGNQTGVYYLSSPGGWRFIGRTPVDLFNENCTPPSLLNSGDYLKFESIPKQKYEQIQKDLAVNDFTLSVQCEERVVDEKDN
ncbi:5-oxoprolinase subunit PxpB [Alkalihalobacterium sp. APHAB7]|uniref:5-oxoprolinase subunit PxpB n=1 Tax=Alkalihalobacterium sp. APHAB7 TaxID=3402081 RepID=UPI003AAF8A05